jgi:hypothetical protein
LTAQSDSVNHSDRQAGAEPSLSTEQAIERLAIRLFWKMEHLDPTEDSEWDGLTDHQKDFYRTCVRSLLCEPRSLLIALGYQSGSPATT